MHNFTYFLSQKCHFHIKMVGGDHDALITVFRMSWFIIIVSALFIHESILHVQIYIIQLLSVSIINNNIISLALLTS